MAHHGSTPKSVLNAPMIRRVVVSDQSDLNRAARRRAYRTLVDGKPVIAYRSKGTIPAAAQIPTRNRPHVKADQVGRRAGKVRRVASALAARVAGGAR